MATIDLSSLGISASHAGAGKAVGTTTRDNVYSAVSGASASFPALAKDSISPRPGRRVVVVGVATYTFANGSGQGASQPKQYWS